MIWYICRGHPPDGRPHRVLDLPQELGYLGFLVGGGLCGATALINHALDVAVGA